MSVPILFFNTYKYFGLIKNTKTITLLSIVFTKNQKQPYISEAEAVRVGLVCLFCYTQIQGHSEIRFL